MTCCGKYNYDGSVWCGENCTGADMTIACVMCAPCLEGDHAYCEVCLCPCGDPRVVRYAKAIHRSRAVEQQPMCPPDNPESCIQLALAAIAVADEELAAHGQCEHCGCELNCQWCGGVA